MTAQTSGPLARSHLTGFYVVGGTVRRDAACYVERRADAELFAGLSSGEFCYVLTSRQMGKSSLMVRTAARLREEGASVLLLDLTAIGQNLTAEQWYDGLLQMAGEQLGIEDELDAFWADHRRLAPLQRFILALRQVVLGRRSRQVVIFVDEIDAVRSLPFSTDEFFAAIRELYSRRAEDAELRGLTFCLMGVASPSDLIRDTRMTPFNVGQRIELTDFTSKEAAVLAEGLGAGGDDGRVLLDRVIHWTGGHPYLTQRLCLAVSQEEGAVREADVDRVCDRLFLEVGARDRDDNLVFARERLLRSEVDLAGLLDVYGRVRAGKRVEDDRTSPVAEVLRLSGVAAARGGVLRVRNRIYERVFDRTWVAANMPDAEIRRQKTAYRKGIFRTAAVAIVVVCAMAGISWLAWSNSRLAESRERESRQLLYVSRMHLVEEAYNQRQYTRVDQMLDDAVRDGGQALRGFEWYYYDRLRAYPITARVSTSTTSSVIEFSPARDVFVYRGDDGVLRVCRMTSGETLRTLSIPDLSGDFAIAPDGAFVAGRTRQNYNNWHLWDGMTGRDLLDLGDTLHSTAFSPDGRLLALASGSRVVVLALGSLHEIASYPGSVGQMTFSEDERMLAALEPDGVTIFKLTSTKPGRKLALAQGWICRFSPDGSDVAVGGTDGTVSIIDVEHGTVKRVLTGQQDPIRGHAYSPIFALAYSPDGKRLLSGGGDSIVNIWNLETNLADTVSGNSFEVGHLSFSSDGAHFVSSGIKEVIVRDAEPVPQRSHVLKAFAMQDFRGGGCFALACSPSGDLLAIGDEQSTVWLIRPTDGTLVALINLSDGSAKSAVVAATFTPDGKTLVASDGITTVIYDVDSAAEIGRLQFGSINAVVSPDGRKLVLRTNNESRGRIRLLDLLSLHQEFETDTTLEGRGLAISPDGRLLAFDGSNNSVTLFDLDGRKETASFTGPAEISWDMAFSPTGEYLAVASYDTNAYVLSVPGLRLVAKLSGHTQSVNGIAFSPDGRRLITGGYDRDIRVWDTATFQVVATLVSHTNAVAALRFAPTDDSIISIGYDGTVRKWDGANRGAAP